MAPLEELENAFEEHCLGGEFLNEYWHLLRNFVGRPTPVTFLPGLTKEAGGAKIYAKREDLCHTGAHKINNAIGQALLAKKLGKPRIIAETGAGQHGVATATACAFLGLECVVYMGEVDARRQAPNLQRMKLLGAKVELVTSGQKILKDAINEAMRDWITNVETTHYLVGSAIGPDPFPRIVRYFQKIIGDEARKQMLTTENKLPAAVLACVGGGSNAIGLFSAFTDSPETKIIGVQAAGPGKKVQGSTPLIHGTPGILHGTKTMLLQNQDGQLLETHSIAPGLDYPAVGPEHAHLLATGRAHYVSATDNECLDAFKLLAEKDGIIAALESCHAVHAAIETAKSLPNDQYVLFNLSGRGDKDLESAITALEKRGETWD